MAEARSPAIYLIDGSAFIFRAFHAMQPLTRPGDGVPVNAVYGFCTMVWRLMEQFGSQDYAVIFDAARENFRNSFYPQYKANRQEMPAELSPQIPLTREAVRAFGLPCVEIEGFEADDLIATYARLASAGGRRTVIVSSDKDLMQLIRPDVQMYDPMKQAPIGPDQVMEKFGVPPEKVADVQALAGDPVDNVPGVPGIGVKTAAELINTYGDLETLLARAMEIKQPKRREVLLTHAEQARISKRLVLLDDHAPVHLADLHPPQPDPVKLGQFLSRQGFRSLLTKVEAKLGRAVRDAARAAEAERPAADLAATGTWPESLSPSADAEEVPLEFRPGRPPVVTETQYALVVTEDDLDRWIAVCAESGTVGFDTETDGLSPSSARLVGISLAPAPGLACYIPVGHQPRQGDMLAEPPQQLPLALVLERLRPLLEDPAVLKIGHNIKFDLQMLALQQIRVAPFDDTMLLSYVLEGRTHDQNLDFLAKHYLNHTTILYSDVAGKGKTQIPFSQVALERARDYAAEDADIALRLWMVFKPRLAQRRLTTVYERLERPLIPVIAEMEMSGILIDEGALAEMSRRFDQQIIALEGEIHQMAGGPFSIGSPKQLGEVLFNRLGLPSAGKTPGGDFATGVQVLEPLAEQGHEIVARILDWRQLTKLKSTYTDGLREAISPRTGRVHTSFQMAATSTGRLSSTDPNLQNIPIRTEEGKRIRTAFVAAPGHVLLSVDYSQIELRLIAVIADVKALQEAFRQGIDIHALTASQMFNVPLLEVTGELRRRAKAINFGIIYGISAFGLARQLGISRGEAGDFIRSYLTRFHEIQLYMQAQREFCAEHGYVQTLDGRRCWIPEIRDRNQARRGFAERQAINAPIQGTAADIMKRAMVRVHRELIAAGLQSRLLLQVHDELVLEVPEAEIGVTGPLVKSVMEGAAALSVPLVADVGMGRDWASAH